MPVRKEAAVTLRGSRALVTGGLGLIGSHIADELVRGGATEIVILDNFARGTRANLKWALENGPVTIVNGDIRNPAVLEQVMAGIDVVFHQAGMRITQCTDDPRLGLEVLADGTFNVLEAAVKAGVRKVVAASSASIYGAAEDYPTREVHHAYGNRTLYGAAKLFNEGLMRSFNEMYGLDYVALRYFNVYGPRMDVYGAYTEVFIRWMNGIADGKAPVIFGDGHQTMDFVHVRDVARANLLAAAAPATDVALNIASGSETSLNQLAEQLLAAMDSKLTPEHAPERKVNPVPRRLADIRQAQELIGYQPSVSLADGLKTLVAWWHDEQCAKIG